MGGPGGKQGSDLSSFEVTALPPPSLGHSLGDPGWAAAGWSVTSSSVVGQPGFLTGDWLVAQRGEVDAGLGGVMWDKNRAEPHLGSRGIFQL